MTDSGKTMVSMRLPDDMLAEVDVRAQALGINRSVWFTNMTRWVLENTYTNAQGVTRRRVGS